MLAFLRRHQRLFFLFTTIVVVISFSFFGTLNTFMTPGQPSDRIVSQTSDGKPIYEGEIKMLNFLLGEDQHHSRISALFNDGVLEKDFLDTGLAGMLVENYYEELSGDIDDRLQRAQRFSPYVHPGAPFISAEMVWQNFAPTIRDDLVQLKSKSLSNVENFNLLADLYMKQTAFSPEILRQVLLYQQKQYNWIQFDPQLPQTDLCLFGFHTKRDWFGPKFLDLISQFIIHAANHAQQKGYRVNDEEVRAELLQNVYDNLEAMQQEPSYAKAEQVFQEQLAMMHLSERKLIDTWRHISLFRRVFNEVGNSIYLDPFIYEEFASYAGEGVAINQYELPPHLRMHKMWELFKLQHYINKVGLCIEKGGCSDLALPALYKSVSEVEVQCPELLQKHFTIEYSSVDQSAFAPRISLKQIWNWQVDEGNFKLIQHHFSSLAFLDSSTEESRYRALDNLDTAMRLQVDAFAQSEIINSHRDWIVEELANGLKQKVVIKVGKTHQEIPLHGIEDPEELITLLSKAALSNGENLSGEELQADKELGFYSPDKRHYFSIKLIERSEENEILTFQEANKHEILDRLLTNLLKEAYPKIRHQDSNVFLNDEGEWMPFEQVKEEVGMLYFNSLLEDIEQDYHKATGKEPVMSDLNQKRSFYTANRFHAHLRKVLRLLETNASENIEFFVTSSSKEPVYGEEALQKQWRLVKRHDRLTRNDRSEIDIERLLSCEDEKFTPIECTQNNELRFFYIEEHFLDQEFVKEKTEEGRKLLADDAKRTLMAQLLEQIKEREGISL